MKEKSHRIRNRYHLSEQGILETLEMKASGVRARTAERAVR